MAKDEQSAEKSPPPPVDIEKRHRPERVLALSDGVVAIAVTVLILPLADIDIPSHVFESNSLTSYIWDNYSQLIASFIISWLVIITYWFDHHRLFGKFKYVDDFTIRVNMLWLFAIVVMPFPTNLLGQNPDGPTGQSVAFYLVILFVTSLSMCIIELHADRHPDLRDPKQPWSKNSWVFGLAATVYFFVLAVLAPFIGGGALWGLLGLFALGLVSRKINLGEPDTVPGQ